MAAPIPLPRTNCDSFQLLLFQLTVKFNSAEVFRKVLQGSPEPGIQLGSEFSDGLDQIIRQALIITELEKKQINHDPRIHFEAPRDGIESRLMDELRV